MSNTKIIDHGVPKDAISDGMIDAVAALKAAMPNPVHFVLVVIGEDFSPRVASNLPPSDAQELFGLLAGLDPNNTRDIERLQ